MSGGICSRGGGRSHQDRTCATEEGQKGEAIWDEDTVVTGHNGGLHAGQRARVTQLSLTHDVSQEGAWQRCEPDRWPGTTPVVAATSPPSLVCPALLRSQGVG